MDRYTLTFEGRMRFRRMMARVGTESWEGAEDYEVLNFIYEHGSATLEEIAQHARLSWDQTTASSRK